MMQQNFIRGFILSLSFFLTGVSFAQKYEAEKATLSGSASSGAIIRYSTSASGGAYVEMREGDISFSVQVQEKGVYEVRIVYALNESYKAQNLVVNGSTSGIVSFQRTGNLVFKDVKAFVRLNAGTNTIAITKSWGWVNIDYIELAKHQPVPFTIVPDLVTPQPTESARKLYAFLRENFQKKTISGVMTGTLLTGNTPLPLFSQAEVAYIYSASGKRPALVGFDFMHSTGKESGGPWYKAYSSATLSMATKLWEEGGIPAFCWHWRNPLLNDNHFYTDSTSFDLTTAFTNSSCTAWNTSSAAYKAIIRDIDFVSGLLKQLQDKDIAVLWRPLHEASGKWFWWGAKGTVPCKALYRLMFDRMLENGVRNLIWVWTTDGADYDWYPGDDYVDILGRDFYYSPRQANHSSLIGEFEALKNVFGTNKIITLSENGSVPYPANMQDDNAHWSYFMPWYGGYARPVNGSNDNTAADWKLIMNHDYVITLEDMPGWQNYIYTEVEDNKAVLTSVYPTRVKDIVYVVCPDSGYSIIITDSGGRLISFVPAVNGNTTISCQGWDPGVYYLSVISINGKKTYRMIK
jgi:mannan endo-1,4-beta-mannosidase